ncbi:uncharacterized protein LOC128669430 isoform X2 [Plodia interpunctella]|uniref:uncharacterized protein LOC128669430 isoform X2 n=1 Tax=Plodia interpunctella TaxID=58824 RepID=UPI0023688848|nr:uncharacterized protein LOC128669430 isoform X2 [Plodia interpunctella]
MSYGKLRRFLSEEYKNLGIHDSILLESPFIETTRSGKYLYKVLLGITLHQVMVALDFSPNVKMKETDSHNINLQYIYPLEFAEIIVFKRSRRQALKLCIKYGKNRYFELAAMNKRQIFWDLWCYQIAALRNTYVPKRHDRQTNYKNNEEKKKHPQWRDKYLYLGSRREKEDKRQPVPVPGLGPTEEIKLLYLKPQYFGCWDQTEHWVQCEISGSTLSEVI